MTLVGIGYTTTLCHQAADELEAQGYSAEVIDLLWVSPLDNETIVESVKKTRKVVRRGRRLPRAVASPATFQHWWPEEAFDYLDAPPRRVTPPHTSVPYSPALEQLYVPTKDKVVEAALAVLQ